MTNRYDNGKIYTIRSHMTDKYYIGSSCLPLHKRLYHHKQHYNKWLDNKHNYITSYEILKYDDVYIELLEEFKCNNKMELLKREGELIIEHKNNIVNIIIPNRYKKEQNQENYKKNRDERLEKQKQYYIDNKDKIKERTHTKITCECMAIINIYEKSRHLKSKKHLTFMKKD